MHEMALTDKILKIALTEAERNGAQKVNKVKIRIGELSGIIEDCVAYYFQLIARDTIAADAKLEFNICKATLFCPNCEREFEKKPRDFNCPICGGLSRLTGAGRECFVDNIEVE